MHAYSEVSPALFSGAHAQEKYAQDCSLSLAWHPLTTLREPGATNPAPSAAWSSPVASGLSPRGERLGLNTTKGEIATERVIESIFGSHHLVISPTGVAAAVANQQGAFVTG